MNKKSLSIVLISICILFSKTCYSQYLQNIYWVNKDKKLINSFTDSYIKDSSNIAHFFRRSWSKDTTSLGKGLYTVHQSIAKGYISINAIFMYKNDSLLGYKITPEMPDEIELREKYKIWYTKIFSFKDTYNISPIYSNYDDWIQPLSAYDGKLKIKNQDILFKKFISVESGDIFGYYNGWNGLHINRGIFEELLPTLNPEKIQLLTYSKNPISRMQAFKYFLTHESEFSELQKHKIKKWMDEIIMDPPKILSAEGDVIYSYPSRKRLMYYVNIDLENAKIPNPDSCFSFGFGYYRSTNFEIGKDSLFYESGCQLDSLDFFLLDRWGNKLDSISGTENPIPIDFSQKINTNGKERFKYINSTYYWVARLTINTDNGSETKEKLGSIRTYR